jgi:hypothetical protein
VPSVLTVDVVRRLGKQERREPECKPGDETPAPLYTQPRSASRVASCPGRNMPDDQPYIEAAKHTQESRVKTKEPNEKLVGKKYCTPVH